MAAHRTTETKEQQRWTTTITIAETPISGNAPETTREQ
jgi:hypothetical protein